MKPAYITEEFLHNFIRTALQEDIGEGDHTSQAAIPSGRNCRAQLLVKERGVIAGVELATTIFKYQDASIDVIQLVTDGQWVDKGDVAFQVQGPARSVLTLERLVLNCLQRMSAIATKTRRMSELIAGTNAQILDTRKTTPNFRLLEKWAVLIGGGKNHRIGLYDAIMLKDNHIDIAGGIQQAIIRTKDYLRATKINLTVEIETRSIREVEEVLAVGGVDTIMLDNMTLDEMTQAVRLIDGRYKTEASGSISEENIADVARCGVDFISIGALTHSVKSLDLSLKVY